MEYIYTALLLHSAGKEINEQNVKNVIQGAGIKADDAKVKALVSALEGVNIEDVIKQAAIPTAVATPVSEPTKTVETKKEEDTSKNEEEAVSGLASLFG